MTLTFENEQDFDLGFDPEEVAAAVINGVLDQMCIRDRYRSVIFIFRKKHRNC